MASHSKRPDSRKSPSDLCYDAVRRGDLEYLRLHLHDAGVDINHVHNDMNKYTMLHKACSDGNSAVAKLLLEDPRIEPNLLDAQAQTPLLWVCMNGSTPTLEVLLESSRVKVNVPDSYGATPLWWAARLNHVEVVRKLLGKREVDLNVRSGEMVWDEGASKTTALEIATKKGNTDVVELLKPVEEILVAPLPVVVAEDRKRTEELEAENKMLRQKLVALEDRSGPQETTVIIEYASKKYAFRFSFPVESTDQFREAVRKRLKLPIPPEIQYFDDALNEFLQLDDIAYLPRTVKTLKISMSQASWWSWEVSLQKGWVTKETDSTQFHSLLINEGSKIYDEGLYKKLKSVAEMHSIDLASVKKAYAISNPKLLQAHENYREVFYSRHKSDPDLFRKDHWRKKSGFEQRLIAMDRLYTEYQKNDWRNERKLSVLSMLHGTTEDVAWKICQNGFGVVAGIDAGYFGKGIYFTSTFSYAEYYAQDAKKKRFANTTHPPHDVYLVASVTPGNSFPVIESPKGPGSYLGAACETGYQSHYVLVSRTDFFPITGHFDAQKHADELVVFENGQAVPFMVIFV